MADRLPGQLTDAEKTARSAQLLELDRINSAEYRSACLGTDIEILAEEKKEIGGKAYWIGHTKTYVKAAFAAEDGGEDFSNRLVTGRAASFLNGEILLLDEIR